MEVSAIGRQERENIKNKWGRKWEGEKESDIWLVELKKGRWGVTIWLVPHAHPIFIFYFLYKVKILLVEWLSGVCCDKYIFLKKLKKIWSMLDDLILKMSSALVLQILLL